MPGAITDVAGIRVGHWTDERARTGCTVILAPPGTVGGVDVRGGAPGTIETDLLRPLATSLGPDAVLLTGGSAYGLAAAAGVMGFLEERGVGWRIRDVVVPRVVGAVIFDLLVGDSGVRPGPDAGYAACAAASDLAPAEGAVGAGCGATMGKLYGEPRPGGVGTASVRVGAVTVGALFVVNALGDVVEEGGTVIGADGPPAAARLLAGEVPTRGIPGAHTTIGVVATDAALTKVEVNLLAQAAHDGLARAVRPAHLPMDGDTVFALATGRAGAGEVISLVTAAAAVSAEAIRRAVGGR